MVLMAMSPNAVANVAPAGLRDAAQPMALAQRGHHALPHLGGGLARERDRQDVAGRHAGFEQPDVAIDQHARLAGAGRGFEGDVAPRIDRDSPRPLIRRFLPIETVEIEARLLSQPQPPVHQPVPPRLAFGRS